MAYFVIFLLFAMTEGQKNLNTDGKCGVVDSISTFVIGGKKTHAEYTPWHVILEHTKETKIDQIVNYCGGNVIAPNFVVTAAHCLWGDRVRIENPKEINVYVGRSSIRPKGEAISVKRIILHDNWDKSNTERMNVRLGHDIALLQLEKELKFGATAQPICLPTVVISVGASATLNGFGLLERFPRITADHLQTANMKIMDKDACNNSWSGKIEGDQLCALGDGVSSCNGDSGSGLIVYVNQDRGSPITVLVGITSFGKFGCPRGKPGVYTNVLSHVDWIEKKILDISNKNKPQRRTTTIRTRTQFTTRRTTTMTTRRITATTKPSNCNITIFTKSYNRGDHQIFSEDQANLGTWDNKLVSLKVKGDCCWRVYTQVNYGGKSEEFCERAYNRPTDIGFLYQDASSMKRKW